MPTYEYYCHRCELTFERVAPISERDKQLCPRCQRPDSAKRKYQSTPFQFSPYLKELREGKMVDY